MKYGSPVTEIRRTSNGVIVSYKQSGAAKTIEADYCICTMPLTLLRSTPNDFSAPYKKVIDECTYSSAYKIAWESRRFWEQDYNIYGGLEFVTVGCSPIWFPSAGLFSERGVLVSGYTDESNSPFSKLTMPEKIGRKQEVDRAAAPGPRQGARKANVCELGKIQYNEGSWIRSYGPGQQRSPASRVTQQAGQAPSPMAARRLANPGYETLIEPDGPIIFAGDHVSHIVAWQEGAALSALRAVQQVADRVKAAKLGGGASNLIQA